MNWMLLMNSALAFGLLFVVLLTVTFFINYKRDRKLAMKKKAHPSRGRYFVRHVPESLANQFKSENAGTGRVELRSEIRKFRYISYIPAATFALAVGFFLFQFGDLLTGPTALTEEELESLNYSEYQWKSEPQPDSPNWPDILKKLKSKRFVFIANSSDLDWTHPNGGSGWGRQTLSEWETRASAMGIPTRLCSWSEAGACRVNPDRDILLVLPGRWVTAKLDDWLSKGASVLLLGSPISIFTDNQSFVWNDLAFERASDALAGPMILTGDQILTLGLPGGRVLPMPPTRGGYRARSSEADAYRLSSTGLFTNQIEAALIAKTVGPGRFVWSDYSTKPLLEAENNESLDLLQTAIFRFLLRESYESVATWPEGKPAAAFLSADVEDGVEDLHLAEESLDKFGWFLLQKTMEKERGWVKKMAKWGELNCHGDTHDAFDTESLRKQTQRLAVCRKFTRSAQDSPMIGFRPPYEKMNNETITAAANAGYDFIFAGRAGMQATPQFLRTVGVPGPAIILISRMISDDHFLFNEAPLSQFDRLEITKLDWEWISRVHGLHTYNFHTQNISAEGHANLIADIRKSVSNNAYFAQPSEVVRWWHVRNRILKNQPVENQDVETFKPVRLAVDKTGKLTRAPITASRAPAAGAK